MVILRGNQIYSRPGKPGRLPTGKSHFFDEVEPHLERVILGPKAVGYTERSLNEFLQRGIAEGCAERAAKRAKAKPAERPSID